VNKMKFYTTLNRIKLHRPCGINKDDNHGFRTLLNYLGKTRVDDNPIDFLTILKSNGLDDTIWCMRSAPEYNKEWRLFAVFCARQNEHLLKDWRSIAAINVAERYAHGQATKEQLKYAAYAAAYAADAYAYAAAAAAADAAYAAAYAADAAAAYAAAYAADAASKEQQEEYLAKLFKGE